MASQQRDPDDRAGEVIVAYEPLSAARHGVWGSPGINDIPGKEIGPASYKVDPLMWENPIVRMRPKLQSVRRSDNSIDS